jgi:hypothetical protein
MDWWCVVDKTLAAEKIRARLEQRIASMLGCQPHELPHTKIGTLTHFAFLLEGTSQAIGGFETTMRALLDSSATRSSGRSSRKRSRNLQKR